MSTTASKYTHAPLTGTNNTRVIHLQPARKRDAPVQFSLKEICLDDVKTGKTSFDALSYAWGAKVGDRPVSCDGKIMLVTENCLHALQHLRLKQEPLVLWVDSICINQSEDALDERSQQVQIMGNIYSLARHVYLWLGLCSHSKLRKFLRHLHRVSVYQKFRSQIRYVDHFSELLNPLVRRLELQHDHGAQILDDLEYFSRAWTLQELIVADHAIVVCRKWHMSWESFAQSFHSRFVPAMRMKSIIVSHFWYREAMNENRLSPMPDGEANNKIVSKTKEKAFRYRSLEQLHTTLDEIRLRSCSDPRDKIFSLYSVFTAYSITLIPADYNASIAEVYRKATTSFIQQLRSLEPLLGAFLLEDDKDEQRTADLPSWVPDYNRKYRHVSARFMIDLDRTAMSPDRMPKFADGRLSVLSLELCQVSKVCSRMATREESRQSYTHETSEDALSGIMRTLEQWIRNTYYVNVSMIPDPRTQQLVDLLICVSDLLGGSKKMEMSHHSKAEQIKKMIWKLLEHEYTGFWRAQLSARKKDEMLFKAFFDTKTPNFDLGAFWRSIVYMTAGLQLFITTDLTLGLAVGAATQGDKVVLLYGLGCPVIVRPHGEHYLFIGPALMIDIPDDMWPRTGSEEGLQEIELV
jgi:hypothetical protein